MTDRREHPFAMDDAAYVLGALPPAEREAFERHLRECARCRESVGALAGLPGLLRAVPPEVAVAAAFDDDDTPAAPAGLLDAVLAEVGRRRRVTVLAVAAAAVAVSAAVAVPRLAGDPSPQEPRQGEVVALEQVDPGPLAVTARLDPVAWGTRIELLCEYETPDAAGGYRAAPTYSLVLEAADGNLEQVATWRAVPGRAVTIEAATALPPGRIAEIEVRRGDGAVVLRAAP